LIVGCHTSVSPGDPIEPATRYWEFIVFNGVSDNNLVGTDTIRILGVNPPADFNSGVSVGDIDGDGDAEIFLSTHPDLYVVDYDSQQQNYEIVWHYEECRARTVMAVPLEAGAKRALLFDGEERFESWSLPGQSPLLLPAVSNFQAEILNEHDVLLTWDYPDSVAVSGFDSSRFVFHLFRFPGGGDIVDTHPLPFKTQSFIDTTMNDGYTYRYELQVEFLGIDGINYYSNTVQLKDIQAEMPSALLSASMQNNPQLIQLDFSKPLAAKDIIPENFHLIPDSVDLTSIMLLEGGTTLLLTYAEPLPMGQYSIEVDSLVTLQNGVRISSEGRSASLTITDAGTAPYIQRVEMSARGRLDIWFDQPMDVGSLLHLESWDLPAPLSILQIVPHVTNSTQVTLLLEPESLLQGRYTLHLRDVVSAEGLAIQKGRGDDAEFQIDPLPTTDFLVFPNPVYASQYGNRITLANIPVYSTVMIADILGRVIQKWQLTESAQTTIQWNLRDKQERPVPSGIYIYAIDTGGKSLHGTFTVLR